LGGNFERIDFGRLSGYIDISRERWPVGIDIEGLEAERRRLYGELSEIGDLRRGSVAETYRRCGKSTCACGEADHPGHGPRYLLMTKVEGRSRAQDVPAGPELAKVRREVANHQRFRSLVQQIVEVNEALCQIRPMETSESSERRALKKKLPRSSKRRPRAKPSG
jgi:hypothetical protein